MATQSPALPTEINVKLSRLAMIVRSLAVVRGAGTILLVVALAIAACLAIDYAWEFGSTIRTLLLALVGLIGVGCAWKTIVQPVARSMNAAELAAIVEDANPGLLERLTSTIELNDPTIPESHKGSRYMRDRLAEQTVHSVRDVAVTNAVSPAGSLRNLAAGTAACVLLTLPLLFWSSNYQLMLSRFFTPWGNFDRPTNLYFSIPDGDRVIARGRDVLIEAHPEWRTSPDTLPEFAWLNWTIDDGESELRRMDYDDSIEAYAITLPHVMHGFRFNVSAERSRTRNYDVQVVEAPQLRLLTLVVEPPAYSGLPAESHDGVIGPIEVFERSNLTFRIETNKPVSAVEFAWLDDDPSPVPVAPPGADGIEPNVLVAADGQSAVLNITALRGGRFEFRLHDEFGLGNDDEPERSLVVIPDRPPELQVAGADREEDARPDDVIEIPALATDDIAVGALELHYQINESPPVVKTVDHAELGRRSVTGNFRLDLADLNLQHGQFVTWRIRAADERPIPEPNETWSDPHVISVRSDANPHGSRQLARQQEGLKQELQRILDQLNEQREQAKNLEDDVRKNRDADEISRQNEQIGAVARETETLARDVNELAERLSEHPLFADMAHRASEVATTQLPDAAREFNESADQEEAGQRRDHLDVGRESLTAAERQLQSIDADFDHLAELERDLLELERLAHQAERIAEQTAQLEEQRASRPENLSDQQEAERQNEISAQQHQMLNEQRDLAADLDNLLERRPEIVEAARREQLDRLEELARRAEQLQRPQAAIADALHNEAREAGQRNQPLLEQQQQALAEAQRIAEEARRDDQLPVVDPEHIREAMDELRNGNTDQAVQQQETAANELQQLADELNRPRGQVGDPEQAVRDMAQQQSALAEQIQQHADQQPTDDAPPQEQQNHRDQARQLAEQQAQLQSQMAELQLPPEQRNQQQAATERANDALEQLLDNDARKAIDPAQQSAQQLEQLANALRDAADPANPQNAGDRPENSQRENNPSENNPSENDRRPAMSAEQLAAAARNLADQQRALRNEAQQAADEQNPQDRENALQEVAERQSALQQQASQLPADQAALPRAEAAQQMSAARDALNEQQAEPAMAAQSRAEEALRELARQADENAAAENQRQELRADAEQLAQNLQDLNEQLAGRQPSSEQQQNNEQPPSRSPAQQAQAAQQQLAQAAEELSRDVAEQSGEQSAAARRAEELADQAQEAAVEAAAGQFQEAARTGEQVQERANQTAGELGQQNDPAATTNSQRAEDIARQQAALNEQLSQLAESRQDRNSARQSGQQALGRATEQLANDLQDVSQRLSNEPLSLPEAGNDAQAAQDAAAQAQQEMQQASRQMQNGDTGNASQSARSAAEALQRAAQAAAQGTQGQQPSNTPVPNEVGTQVAQASEQLRQAGEQLEAALQQNSAAQNADDPQMAQNSSGEPSPPGQNPAGEPQSGPQPGSQAQADGSQGQSSSPQNGDQPGSQPSGTQPSTPGQQPGQQSGQQQSPSGAPNPAGQQNGPPGAPAGSGQSQSAMQQFAQMMQNAADSLSQAMQNARPQNGPNSPGTPQSASQQATGQSETDNSESTAAALAGMEGLIAAPLNGATGQLSGRDWGRLPGKLKTEILQGSNRNTTGDYSRLIKLYFREIAGDQANDGP